MGFLCSIYKLLVICIHVPCVIFLRSTMRDFFANCPQYMTWLDDGALSRTAIIMFTLARRGHVGCVTSAGCSARRVSISRNNPLYMHVYRSVSMDVV